MTRVEWSALSGDEVETVLSNLLYNWNEHALRIRPSRGDYGIDVIVPTTGAMKNWGVYQVKKFATNLDASQKGQIESSFRRVLVALVRRKVPLNDWYLVTPLDPTLDNLLDWFNQSPSRAIDVLANDEKLKLTAAELATIKTWIESPDRVIAWKGLNFCENLAGDCPNVIDYYLHGGRDRLRDAVADLSKLLSFDSQVRARDASAPGEGPVAALQPGEIRDHLQRLDRVLDTDPHFRYGYSLDLNCPDLRPEPRLVAATQESLPGGRYLTFKIYARSAQSLDEHPIPAKLEFSFEDSSEDRAAFEVWRKYGRPLDVEASFSAGLPGAERRTGRIRLSPAEGEENHFCNRMRIVDPEGAVLGELAFTMSSTTGLDRTGRWAHGVDDTGILSTESLLDATSLSGSIDVTLPPVAGLEASKALPAITFAGALTSPNMLQVAGEYGPFADFSPIGFSEPLADPTLVRFVQALATIQSVTRVPIRIPDVDVLTPDDIGQIRRAAALIGGQTTVGKWTELIFEKNPDINLEVGEYYQIAVIDPFVCTSQWR